jgi:hypothetical protein
MNITIEFVSKIGLKNIFYFKRYLQDNIVCVGLVVSHMWSRFLWHLCSLYGFEPQHGLSLLSMYLITIYILLSS